MVSNYEKKFDQFFSKEYLTNIETKIREEIKLGLEKERILTPEDALLINKFINKLQNENETRELLSGNARKYAEKNFQIKQISEKFENIINKIIGKK